MHNVKSIEPIVTDIKGLQSFLKVGRNKAMEIGKKSGAEIKLSARCMRYDVEKVREYVLSLNDREGGEECE